MTIARSAHRARVATRALSRAFSRRRSVVVAAREAVPIDEPAQVTARHLRRARRARHVVLVVLEELLDPGALPQLARQLLGLAVRRAARGRRRRGPADQRDALDGVTQLANVARPALA